jgi:hypothetical protein
MSPEERLKQIRGQKPKPVTAKSIVEKHRRTIIDLARNSCATQDEIITVLKEMGEVIPEDGLKAAILSEIGTMKDIKNGRLNDPLPLHETLTEPIVEAQAKAETGAPFDERSFNVDRPERGTLGGFPSASITEISEKE